MLITKEYFVINQKISEVGKAQLPQLRKLRFVLILYFETLRKLRCGPKSLKFAALSLRCAF